MKATALFGVTGRTGISFIKKAVNNYKLKAPFRNFGTIKEFVIREKDKF